MGPARPAAVPVVGLPRTPTDLCCACGMQRKRGYCIAHVRFVAPLCLPSCPGAHQAFKAALLEEAQEEAAAETAALEAAAREEFEKRTLAEAEQRISDAKAAMEAMVHEAEQRAKRAEVRGPC